MSNWGLHALNATIAQSGFAALEASQVEHGFLLLHSRVHVHCM